MATMRASGLGKRQNGAKPSAFELGARRTVQPHVFPSVKTHGAAQMDIHPKDVECHAIRTCVTGQYLLDRDPLTHTLTQGPKDPIISYTPV